MERKHESFVLDNLKALGLEPDCLNWDADGKAATLFIEMKRDNIELLYEASRKGATMYHPVQRKEKSDAQKERYVPAMNNGWWRDYASSVAFSVYPDRHGRLQFKLTDGYQRTASAFKARPPRPMKFVGVVHLCESEDESVDLIRHYNLGQAKTPDDHVLGAHAFSYVHPTFRKMAKNIATRFRYWNSNARGQILPDEWSRLSDALELPLKAFERMTHLVKTQDGYDFEAAAVEENIGGKELQTVYARLVGLLYQARDHHKAAKFVELVLQNEVTEIEPRLLVGESMNSVSKMVLDAYASYCDPSFEAGSASSKKDWPWEEHIPSVLTWPVFDYESAA